MRRGFTIIELVMVVAILGILLGIVTTAASASIRQARSQKAAVCCRVVQAAFETYYAQKGKWPGDIDTERDKGNIEGRNDTDDDSIYVLDCEDARKMMREIIREYKEGNPCLDISGLFVSRYPGNKGSRNIGLDFMTAIRGTPKDKNGQRMKTSEMYFGYPESSHGYFRHFKVMYSKATDRITVSTHREEWNKGWKEGCCTE